MNYCRQANTFDYSKMGFSKEVMTVIADIGATKVILFARKGRKFLLDEICNYFKLRNGVNTDDVDLAQDDMYERKSKEVVDMIYDKLSFEGYIRSDMSHLEWDKLLALLSFIEAYGDRSYVDYGTLRRKLNSVRRVLYTYCDEHYIDQAAYETYDSDFPAKVYEIFLRFLPPQQKEYVNWACENSLQSDVGFGEYYLLSDEVKRLENGYLNFVRVIDPIIKKLKEVNKDNTAFLELLREERLS